LAQDQAGGDRIGERIFRPFGLADEDCAAVGHVRDRVVPSRSENGPHSQVLGKPTEENDIRNTGEN
jgi:hypothetical protein